MICFHIINLEEERDENASPVKAVHYFRETVYPGGLLGTEEHPSEFSFEVILYHPDGSEEREEIHNMVMTSDDAMEFLHLLARSQVTPTTFWDILHDMQLVRSLG